MRRTAYESHRAPAERVRRRIPDRRASRTSGAGDGYILIEVVLALTILAVSGMFIVQSLRHCIGHSRSMVGYTTALYLTQSRLLQLELEYANKYDMRLGRDDGTYRDMGHPGYRWESKVSYDRDRAAYGIKVTTFWFDNNETISFSLETITPTGRVREDLLR